MRHGLLLALLVAWLPAARGDLIIDFGSDVASLGFAGATYTDSGFTFTSIGVGLESNAIGDLAAGSESELILNVGATALDIVLVGSNEVTLTETDASTFDLLDLVIEDLTLGLGTSATITSNLGGSFSITSSGTIDFESAAVVGDTSLWDGVTTITFTASDPSVLGAVQYGVDSIHIEEASVPEPSSAALGLLVLGLAGAARRRGVRT